MGTGWPLALLIAASAFWGLAVAGAKYALGGFGPVTLLAVEVVAATAALWAVLLIRGYRRLRAWWLPVGSDARALATGIESPPAAVPARFWVAAVVGVAGYGVSFLLFNLVIGKVNAGWVAVVLNLIPMFGVFSAVLLLREGVTTGEASGAALISLSVLYITIAVRREARSGMPASAAG